MKDDFKKIEINNHTVEITKIGGGVYKVDVKQGKNLVRSKYLIYDLEDYEIAISPSYLDRPVLVKFDNPVVIAGKSRKKIYILLPIEVDVVAVRGNDEIDIEKITPENVKDAWFGEMHEGSISYFYRSSVFGEPDPDKRKESEVYIPVEIINRDKEARSFEKLLIDSYQLSIYDVNGTWISEKVRVEVYDNEVMVYYTDEPPAPDAKEIKRGEINVRKKGLEKLLKRSLGKIKPRFFSYG